MYLCISKIRFANINVVDTHIDYVYLYTCLPIDPPCN